MDLLLPLSTREERRGIERRRAREGDGEGKGEKGRRTIAGAQLENCFSACLFDPSTVSYICTQIVASVLKVDREKRPEENRQSIERPAGSIWRLAQSRVARVTERGGKKIENAKRASDTGRGSPTLPPPSSFARFDTTLSADKGFIGFISRTRERILLPAACSPRLRSRLRGIVLFQ